MYNNTLITILFGFCFFYGYRILLSIKWFEVNIDYVDFAICKRKKKKGKKKDDFVGTLFLAVKSVIVRELRLKERMRHKNVHFKASRSE